MEAKPVIMPKKKSNDLLLVYVFVFLCLGMLYLVVKPIFEEKNMLDLQVAAKEEDFQKKSELLRSIEDINRNNKVSPEEAKKLADFIAKRNSYEDLYVYLESSATEYNLLLADYKLSDTAEPAAAAASQTGGMTMSESTGTLPTDTREKTRLQKQRLSFTLQGNYNNMSGFLKKLENGIPFLQLVSIAVGNREQAGTTPSTGASPINAFVVNMDFLHY